jgi:ATP-binding cassette subfamily F protein uup
MIEVVKDIADVIPMADGSKLSASQLLNRFLFPNEQHYTQVSKLSGGEKRRLYLLTILIKNPNLLILDEPTNDLDIITLNVLEDFLSEFPGVIIIVSHDRYFMDRVADHLFIFEGDGVIRDFNGNYTDYRNDLAEREKEQRRLANEAANAAKKAAQAGLEKPKVKLSFKDKYELEQLDKEIPALEKEKVELEAKMMTITDHAEIMKTSARIGEVIDALDTKGLRWLELTELAGG